MHFELKSNSNKHKKLDAYIYDNREIALTIYNDKNQSCIFVDLEELLTKIEEAKKEVSKI